MTDPRRRGLLALPLLLGLPRGAPAAADAPKDLVLVRAGTMPVVLTAPHGGEAAIPGVGPRDVRGKGERYNAGQDPRTDRLAIGIADEVKALTGKSPYLVVARFHRKYIDANRPPDVAYDNPASKPYYDHYHGTIRRFVDEVRAAYPRAVLLDVHGQHKDPGVVMRGTINGKSVTKLLERAGFDAVTGPNGLFGQLEAQGLKVWPSNSLPPMARHEDGGFNGGHTTNFYGSHRTDGIDAMQLEFGADYRKPDLVEATAKKAARALAAFYRAYLA